MITDERGSSMAFLLLTIAIIIVVFGIVLELYHTVSLCNYVEKELNRALRLSVETSVMDDYRKDCILKIDSSKARQEFFDYLKCDLTLDSFYTRMDGERVLYKLKFSKIQVKDEPAEFYIEGYVIKPVLLFDISKEFKIPFSIKFINTRLESIND